MNTKVTHVKKGLVLIALYKKSCYICEVLTQTFLPVPSLTKRQSPFKKHPCIYPLNNGLYLKSRFRWHDPVGYYPNQLYKYGLF